MIHGEIFAEEVLSGALNGIGVIEGSLASTGVLEASINGIAQIDGTIETVTRTELDTYSEAYSVKPTINGTKMGTKHKIMSDDVSIEPIPYFETSNVYGTTVYIGG